MKIKSNKLYADNIEYHNTKKKSGKIDPKFIVIHYTASANFEGDVRTLSTSSVQASCQLVVGPNGEIAQIGNLNDNLWHAGRSKWRGYNGLNKYSIGIEVTSPGPVDKIGDNLYKTWYGKTVSTSDGYSFVEARHPNGGPTKYWAVFTQKQIEVLKELVPTLMQYYGIKEVVGHDEISPDRKIDPGPCCPKSLWAAFDNRNVEPEEEKEIKEPLEGFKTYEVERNLSTNLNVRDEANGRKIGSIPPGTLVERLNRRGSWIKIRTPGKYEGWVFGKYLNEV